MAAPSPLLEAFARALPQRKGCPINVAFLDSPGLSSANVLNALAGKELANASAESSRIQEFRIQGPTTTPTPTLFCTKSPSPSPSAATAHFNTLRRRLLHGRPASAFLYVRGNDADPAQESAYLQSLERSLGKTLWRSTICVTVVQPTGAATSTQDAADTSVVMQFAGSEALPAALVSPGYHAMACHWDGSEAATAELAALVVHLVSTTLPFLPEPLDPKSGVPESADQQREIPSAVEGEFADLEEVSLGNMMRAEHSLDAPISISISPAVIETASSELPLVHHALEKYIEKPESLKPESGSSNNMHLQRQHDWPAQGQLVSPAFASLSLAFAPPGLSSITTTRRAPPKHHHPQNIQAKPAPPARQALPCVRARVQAGMNPLSGLNPFSAKLQIPGASLSFSIPRAPPNPRNVTAFPDLLRLPRNGNTFRAPSSAAGVRRVVMVWFRNDLRVHDNEALVAADKDGVAVLPVYCFDPRDYGKSSSGFDRTGPFRARFLLQCVEDLRQNLRERGSDLVVRVGHPEKELLSLAKAVGASALYAHREVTKEDGCLENKVAAVLKDEGVDTTFFWGSTLYHLDDLSFPLDNMPCNYGGFREAVMNLKVRPTMEVPKQLKRLPVEGNVKSGDIPTLNQLGHTPPAARVKMEGPALTGGEGEAMKRLSGFLKEALALQPLPPSSSSSSSLSSSSSSSVGNPQQPDRAKSIAPAMLGASFSCKISPWLAMGCLSPRHMFEEMKAALPSTTSLGTPPGSAGASVSLDWLVFELLWRDFFRFITKKHASQRNEPAGAPVPAMA